MVSRKKEKRSLMARIVNGIVLVANILVSIGFMASAYSGYLSPTEFKFAQIMMYTFPGWLLAIVVLLMLDLAFWRRSAMIAALSLLICLPQVLDFSPFHLPKGKMNEEEQQRSFTLMTYNVMQFANQDKFATIDANEQLDYILSQSPDIVCIEEARCLAPDPNQNHITQEQLAEVNEMYPYVFIEGESFALFSKYEAKAVPIGFPKSDYASGDIACWRLFIDGQTINLFIVHLRSFAFTLDERDLFQEMTTVENVNRQYIKEAKMDLLPKINSSTVERMEQYDWLVKCLKKYGGENTIVCGDFNDPVGCYGLRMLERESKLKQVYTQVGFGPMITYNANNFFFRIDHVLYRGDLTPYSMSRGNLKASDHYPLTTTFLVGK